MPLGGEPEPLLTTEANERAPRFSPDGRYLAYLSDESEFSELHVVSYPDLRNKWTVSSGDASRPEWAPSGRELFYQRDGHLMVVDVRAEPSFTAGAPRVLLDARQLTSYGGSYDVSPDGERFLFSDNLTTSMSLVVILNWTKELKRLVPI